MCMAGAMTFRGAGVGRSQLSEGDVLVLGP